VHESPRFAVLRADKDAHDAMELARILAAVRETPLQDQVLEAKAAWGILGEDLSRSEAEALQHALHSAGLECGIGPMSALVALPAAQVVVRRDALPPVPPTLIAAAALTVTTTSRSGQRGPSGFQKAASAALMMTTGIPIKVGGRKRSVETTHDQERLVFFADLYYGAPSKRLRIDASHFDYSCLGGRMLHHAQGNLKILLGDVLESAPDAWTNHGARVLLQGRPIRTMGYGSLDDLERESRWLLTLRAAGL